MNIGHTWKTSLQMRTRLVSNSVFLFISPPSAFYPNLFHLSEKAPRFLLKTLLLSTSLPQRIPSNRKNTLLTNGQNISMPRVKLSLAPQFHYLILWPPTTRRHVAPWDRDTWQNWAAQKTSPKWGSTSMLNFFRFGWWRNWGSLFGSLHRKERENKIISNISMIFKEFWGWKCGF